MKKLLLVSILFISMVSHAEESALSKNENIEKLMTLTKMDSIVDQMYGQVEIMMQNMATEMGVQSSEQLMFDEHFSEVIQVMEKGLNWKKMKPFYVDLYSNHFTASQIQDMVSFYETETGKATIDKMPALMNEAMQFSQVEMTKLVPEIQALSLKFRENLAEHRKKSE